MYKPLFTLPSSKPKRTVETSQRRLAPIQQRTISPIPQFDLYPSKIKKLNDWKINPRMNHDKLIIHVYTG